MTKIPFQLRDSRFRFAKVKTRKKIAFEHNWNTTCNYSFDSQILIDHINSGGNYGVVSGFGNLVIIDCDTPELEQILKENFPKTFSVKSGKGMHFYFVCPDLDENIRLIDKGEINIGDIQTKGKMIIAPGSIHPSGKQYTVFNDAAITTISAEKIRIELKDFIKKRDPVTHEKEIKTNMIKNHNLEYSQLINLKKLFDRGNGELQGEHPFHGSDGGSNFTLNTEKKLWHCFRHNTGGNIFTLIAIKEGLIKCGDATHGCLKGKKFRELLKIAATKYNLVLEMNEEVEVPDSFPEMKTLVLTHLATRDGRDSATEILTKWLLNENRIYTIRTDQNSEVWVYREGIYVPHGKSYISELCSEVLGKAFTQFIVNNVIDKIRARTFIDPDVFFETFDKKYIAVQNGILDLKEKKLLEFSPEKRFFVKLPIKFDKNAKCPTVRKHFEAVLKNKEDVEVLFEIFGYLLHKDYPIEKAFMFTGTGRNGKSKTLELMKLFLGPENCSAIPLQQFEADQYARANLHQKLANLAGDLSKKALINTGTFKMLTGRDIISASRKYLTRLNFTNFAKMVFSANALPYTYDDSEAFFRRWVILDFPYTFVKQEEMDNATKEEKNKFKLRDPNIIDKLSSEQELSGLLNISIEKLHQVLKNKGFSYTPTQAEIETLWLRRSSSLLAYLQDEVVEDFDNYLTKAEFRREYGIYCRTHKLRMVNDKTIKNVLPTHYGVSEEKKKIGPDRINCWVGITFKNKDAVSEMEENIPTDPREAFEKYNAKENKALNEDQVMEMLGKSKGS